MTERLFFSIRAKLFLMGGLLLLVIALTGFRLFMSELAVRDMLHTRDIQHMQDEALYEIEEKADDALVAFNRMVLDRSPAAVKAFKDRLQDLYSQTGTLDRLVEGEGKNLQTAIVPMLGLDNPLSPSGMEDSFTRLTGIRERLNGIDLKMDGETEQSRQRIRELIDRDPYRSLWTLAICLGLIVMLALVVIRDIFTPLQTITRRLIEAGNYTANIPAQLIQSPSQDEIGMAQQALNDLFSHIARDFKAVREANLQSGRRLAAIEVSRDGIGMVDSEGRLTYGNRALFAIHGIEDKDKHEYLGHFWQKLYTDKGRQDIDDHVMPPLYRDGFWQGETAIARKNGDVRQVDMSLTLLEDGSMVGTVRDITRRKSAEKEREELQKLFAQSQKMEAVGRLTGGVAHDFNNMLTIVSGNLEFLEDFHTDPDSEAYGYIAVARRALARGAELTQRLLSFSRRQVLAPRVLDAAAGLPEMATLIRRAIGESVNLRFAVHPDLWPIRIDPGQLENAILNLAINARDAMAQGGSITIGAENAVLDGGESKGKFFVRPGDYVRITVTDTGHGIPENILPQIFEPFFTTKDVGKGTGLGLSMVYGFVKQSNGYIFIDSQENEGTSIHLCFPRAGLETIVESVALPTAPSASVGETILIAEDEEDVLNLTRSILTRKGYKVLTARNGREAMDVLEGGAAIDLLVTDMIMPGGMTGRDLAERAQRLRPGLKILFVSGYTSESLPEISAFPMSRFLFKPYTQAKLAEEIRALADSSPIQTVMQTMEMDSGQYLAG